MQEATLCLLVRGEPAREVLLGYKKAGFGAGKCTGIGGKVEPDEAVRLAAARELEEEIGVRVPPSDLLERGVLTFLFPQHPSWSQRVTVYLVKTWDGNPQEGAEMAPVWFHLDALPFDEMWQDGRHWLPLILAGQRLRATYTFEADNETISSIVVQPAEQQGD